MSLLNKVICLLAASGMGTSFGGEALATATFLINHSPSSSIEFRTPEEIWTDKQPNISYFRPFGCLAMVHQNLGKLKPRSKKCVLLGYPEGVKGYRLLSLEDPGNQIIISRDYVFNEAEFPLLKFNNLFPKPMPERYRIIDLHFPEQLETQDIDPDPLDSNIVDPVPDLTRFG